MATMFFLSGFFLRNSTFNFASAEEPAGASRPTIFFFQKDFFKNVAHGFLRQLKWHGGPPRPFSPRLLGAE